MLHLDVPQLLGLLVIILGSAKVLGMLAQRIGQPAVLGELVAGVVLGCSVFGLVNPKNEPLQVFAEIGVVILLFEIGLETDLANLLKVGGASAAVALVGVVVPFGLGYGVAYLLGLETLVAIVAGATLTATSVGITARVLSDLGRLQEPESQIVLGAAILDDIIGLIVLAVVAGLTEGGRVTPFEVLRIAAAAFGFLVVTVVAGGIVVPPLVRTIARFRTPGTTATLAMMFALGFAWLAWWVGSALLIGAFAAGLLLRRTTLVHEIEKRVAHLGQFFVPIFFVTVGAALDLRVFNPIEAANRQTLLIGGMLILAAVAGKFVSGYAPFWFRGKKSVIGVGMIPRGEVGLIFAQTGLASGVFDDKLFSATALMVMVTTFVAPPLLRVLFPPVPHKGEVPEADGLQELVTKA
jgi:Kef-type K+ transport system membrane component KefB